MIETNKNSRSKGTWDFVDGKYECLFTCMRAQYWRKYTLALLNWANFAQLWDDNDNGTVTIFTRWRETPTTMSISPARAAFEGDSAFPRQIEFSFFPGTVCSHPAIIVWKRSSVSRGCARACCDSPGVSQIGFSSDSAVAVSKNTYTYQYFQNCASSDKCILNATTRSKVYAINRIINDEWWEGGAPATIKLSSRNENRSDTHGKYISLFCWEGTLHIHIYIFKENDSRGGKLVQYSRNALALRLRSYLMFNALSGQKRAATRIKETKNARKKCTPSQCASSFLQSENKKKKRNTQYALT